MTAVSRPTVLCVDDDPQVLEGISVHLRRRYTVATATSGAAGLELLRKHPDTAVILSDMRMPGMDGARFLEASRAIAPDARRIVLTGYSDVPSAIAAINAGQICRFLTKPCETKDLLEAVAFALAEFQAEMADRSAIRRSTERFVIGHDRTTGLASRERLLEVLGETMLEMNVVGESAGVLCLVEFRFPSTLADEHDPIIIDQLVRCIADRLQDHAASARCVARWSSQSFAILEAATMTTGESLNARGLALVDAITQPLRIGTVTAAVEASVGLNRTPGHHALRRTGRARGAEQG
jgi:response regulator RpfG family c-di-GMP phosphodiesterase